MRTFSTPRSQIIEQGDKMYKILKRYPRDKFLVDGNIDKTKLGWIVKWEEGDHVVQHDNKLLICEEIKQHEYETISETSGSIEAIPDTH